MNRYPISHNTKEEVENNLNPCEYPEEVENNLDPCEYPDMDGTYTCPYSDDPTSDMCRNYCGCGVDE